MNNIREIINSKNILFPGLKKYLVNTFYNITDFLDISDFGAVFCPFHSDSQTGKPSAKLYKDDDMERIWCFSERKMYFAWDVISILLQKDPIQMLIKDYSEKEILYAIDDYIKGNKGSTNKSKLPKDYEKLNVEDFIELVCTGEYNGKI